MKNKMPLINLYLLTFLFLSCTSGQSPIPSPELKKTNAAMNNTNDTAILANGCFWCTEAVFQNLKGVSKVTSGYIGGHLKNPTYEQVSSGRTGHAEALEVEFDPSVISYEELLEIFWNTHDPTTLNRQGNDVGTQYRSGIFYKNEHQKELAQAYKNQLDKSGVFKDPIVTEITEATTFFPAEDYHQNYYKLNGNQPYCRFVIRPKVEKMQKYYKDKLKTD